MSPSSSDVTTTDIGQEIRYELAPLSAEHIEDFRHATRTLFTQGIPLTFVTHFRRAEFNWLDRLKVNMRHLLHTDQAYEYVTPLKVGDKLVVTTKLVDIKERRGLKFVDLESRVMADKELRNICLTTFIVRTPAAAVAK